VNRWSSSRFNNAEKLSGKPLCGVAERNSLCSKCGVIVRIASVRCDSIA
jgi:hypothetical protein